MSEKELGVIYEAKDLCRYIITITEKSPKKYRFTFINKLQINSIEIIEQLLLANMTFVENKDKESYNKRYGYQKKALTTLKILGYIAELSMEAGCILKKQYENITKQIYTCQNMLIAWIKSDKKRFQ